MLLVTDGSLKRKYLAVVAGMAVACVIALWALFWSGEAADGGGAEEERPFRVGASILPDDLHPLHAPGIIPIHQIYSHLFLHKFKTENMLLEIEPDIVDKHEISDDGRICRIHIRHGIKFHNGSDLTSEDVIYTWERFLNTEPDTLGIRFPKAEVKAIDSSTILFTSAKPVDWKNVLTIPVLNKEYESSHESRPSKGEHRLIGSGPYMLEKYDKGKKIVYMKRFDGYFRGAAKIKNLEIHYVPESWMAVLALETDKIDYYINIGGKDVEQLKRNKSLQVFSFADNYNYQVLINTTKPPFNDERLRKALDLMIDRREIVKDENGVNNLGLPTDTVLHFSKPYTTPTVGAYTPGKAKELLQLAGMVKKGGILHWGGKPFEINILMSKHNEDYINAVRHIVSAWEENGIICRISMVDFETLYDSLNNCKYETSFIENSDKLHLLHNIQYLSGGQMMYTGFASKEISDIFNKLSNGADIAFEDKIRVQEIINVKAPLISLFYRIDYGALNKRFPLDEYILQDPYGLRHFGGGRMGGNTNLTRYESAQ